MYNMPEYCNYEDKSLLEIGTFPFENALTHNEKAEIKANMTPKEMAEVLSEKLIEVIRKNLALEQKAE